MKYAFVWHSVGAQRLVAATDAAGAQEQRCEGQADLGVEGREGGAQGLSHLGANPKSGNRAPPSPSAKSRHVLAFQTVGISAHVQFLFRQEQERRASPILPSRVEALQSPRLPCLQREPHHSEEGRGVGRWGVRTKDRSGSTRSPEQRALESCLYLALGPGGGSPARRRWAGSPGSAVYPGHPACSPAAPEQSPPATCPIPGAPEGCPLQSTDTQGRGLRRQLS